MKLSDFEVLAKSYRGHRNDAYGYPVLTFYTKSRKPACYYNATAIKLLDARKGDRIRFLKRLDKFYVMRSGIDDSGGYALHSTNDSGAMLSSAGSMFSHVEDYDRYVMDNEQVVEGKSIWELVPFEQWKQQNEEQ